MGLHIQAARDLEISRFCLLLRAQRRCLLVLFQRDRRIREAWWRIHLFSMWKKKRQVEGELVHVQQDMGERVRAIMGRTERLAGPEGLGFSPIPKGGSGHGQEEGTR